MNEEHNAKWMPQQWVDPALRAEVKAIALKQKPRGKKAREFYRFVGSLVEEAEFLKEIEGQEARDRQVAIGEELSRYKFPAASDMWEYDMAQQAGKWEHCAQFGGEYYPEAQREADAEAAYESAEREYAETAKGACPVCEGTGLEAENAETPCAECNGEKMVPYESVAFCGETPEKTVWLPKAPVTPINEEDEIPF